MLEQICAFIHNYFVGGVYSGTFTVTGGVLELPHLVPGQYFRVVGSRFNDGVWKCGFEDMTDETFTGEIWDMRPPRAFLKLAEDIKTWQDKYGAATQGPYQSESFNDYSYTKGTATDATGNSAPVTWQTTFRTYLNQWRKLA